MRLPQERLGTGQRETNDTVKARIEREEEKKRQAQVWRVEGDGTTFRELDEEEHGQVRELPCMER